VDLSAEDRQPRPGKSAAANIRINIVTDGKTWERNIVHTGLNCWISLWVSGLPEGAAKADIKVRLGGEDLPVVFLSEADPEGLRQINATLPSDAQPGDYSVSVGLGGTTSVPFPVRLV